MTTNLPPPAPWEKTINWARNYKSDPTNESTFWIVTASSIAIGGGLGITAGLLTGGSNNVPPQNNNVPQQNKVPVQNNVPQQNNVPPQNNNAVPVENLPNTIINNTVTGDDGVLYEIIED